MCTCIYIRTLVRKLTLLFQTHGNICLHTHTYKTPLIASVSCNCSLCDNLHLSVWLLRAKLSYYERVTGHGHPIRPMSEWVRRTQLRRWLILFHGHKRSMISLTVSEWVRRPCQAKRPTSSEDWQNWRDLQAKKRAAEKDKLDNAWRLKAGMKVSLSTY